MSKTVELLFDFVSPNAYLAYYPMRDIAARQGAELVLTPVFLGGMHKLSGNTPPFIRDAEIKGKNAYAMLEMRRFIAKHGFDKYTMNPCFPFNSITLQRLLLAASEDGRAIEFAEFLLPHVWENGADMTDGEVVAGLLEASAFDGAAMMARIQAPDLKQKLIDNTEGAVERGAFGIPTFFVGEDMFFGKENLGNVEEALAG